MRVDYSDWLARPGLVMREYTYSQMDGARDFKMEVHVDIQAGLGIYTFVNFIISDFDLTRETPLRCSLRPMDGSKSQYSFSMIGRPNHQGDVVIGALGSDDQKFCLRALLDGKDMHFEVDTVGGDKLIRLPLPNDPTFESAYRRVSDAVKAADDAEFKGKDGILGRIDRLMRNLSGR